MRIRWKAKHGLTLKWDFKRPKVVFGSSLFEQTRFLEKKKRKWGEKLGFARRSGFDWDCFPFLPPKGSSNLQEEI